MTAVSVRQKFDWLRLWATFGFIADTLVLLDGGISTNPFLAWAGLGGIIGAGLTSLFGKKTQKYVRYIFLSSGLSMLASGVDLFAMNDSNHPGQAITGFVLVIAFICLFWIGKPKMAFALFCVATVSLLCDGMLQSGWMLTAAAGFYILSDICASLIPSSRIASAHEA